MEIERQPWEQVQNESEKAYAAFCQYLELPKRGSRTKSGAPRRFVQDLAQQLGKTNATLNKWYVAWDWEDRAVAYDNYMNFHVTDIAEVEDRKQFGQEIRTAGKRFREISMQALGRLDYAILSTEDIVRLMKLGVDLEERAAKIDKPAVEGKRDQLKSEIAGLLGALTAKLGGSAGSGSGGTITATERTVSFGFPGGDEQQPVQAIQTLPGEVCEGSSRTKLVVETD